MANEYHLNWSDTTKTDLVIQPSTKDVSSTSLVFTGRGSPNWGEDIQENLLKLLESFSSPTAPLRAVSGQLWFDSVNLKLRVYNSATATWLSVAPDAADAVKGLVALNTGATTGDDVNATAALTAAGLIALLGGTNTLTAKINSSGVTQAEGTSSTQFATTAFVQAAVGGYINIVIATGTTTLTLTAAQASNPVIKISTITGAPLTTNLAVIVPTSINRIWGLHNETVGAFTVTVKTATGTGVTIAQTKRNLVYTDGANVYDAFTDFESISLSGIPTAPTALAATAPSTQIATTAYVHAAAAAEAAASGYLLRTVSATEATAGVVVLTAAEAGKAIIEIGGTLTKNIKVTIPTTTTGKTWLIFNNTTPAAGTGPFTLQFGESSTASAVFIASGKRNLVYSTDTNMYDAFTDFESIALSGTPTAPTATLANSNGQQIANTEFVQNATASFATLASPTFTGNPKSVTPADGDNDTSIATTAFVQSAVNGIGSRIITTSSSFTVPAATTRIYVSLVGGGGGGAGSLDIAPYAGGGGGSGGVVYRQAISVSPGQVIAVTIGVGGSGGRGLVIFADWPLLDPPGNYTTCNGGAGGASSFGTLATASGGGGGRCQATHSHGGIAGGTSFCGDGKSGDFLATTNTEAGGDGGGNVFSATSPGGHDSNRTGTLYGGGGCGGRATGYWISGQAGAPGLCIVEW